MYFSEIDTESAGEISREQFKKWFLIGPKPKQEEQRMSYADLEAQLAPVVAEEEAAAEEEEGARGSDSDAESSEDEQSDEDEAAAAAAVVVEEEVEEEVIDEFTFGRRQGLAILPELVTSRRY